VSGTRELAATAADGEASGRRIPIVDAGRPIGIVSLTAHARSDLPTRVHRHRKQGDMARTLQYAESCPECRRSSRDRTTR
jgi:hypothetical protein